MLAAADKIQVISALRRRRNVCSGLVILLIQVFLWPNLAWAFEAGTLAGRILPALVLNQKPLTLPGTIGTVLKGRQGRGKTIIVVQDLHCHYEVQMNIARLLELLARDYGIRLVGVEGAFQTLNPARLRKFPESGIRREICSFFVRHGQMSGAEYAAATLDQPIRLEGIESPELYERSLAKVHLFLNSESLAFCVELKDRLEVREQQTCGPALKAWRETSRAYQTGRMDLLRFCMRACETAQAAGLDLTKYPVAETYGRKSAAAAELEQLFSELDKLDLAISKQLAATEQERRLLAQGQRLDILERMLNIAATQDDLAAYRGAPQEFRAEAFLEPTDMVPEEDREPDPEEIFALNNFITAAAEFYALADCRSQAFVKNLETKMDRLHEQTAVLITGGFHAPGIMAALEAGPTGYVQVAPRLSRWDMVNPYYGLLAGRQMPLEKLLERNEVLLALRSRLPDSDFGPEQVIPRGKLGPARVFADWSESLLEFDWIARLAQQGRSPRQILNECRARLLGNPVKEPGVGARLDETLVQDNAQVRGAVDADRAFVVIPADFNDQGQAVKVVVRWDNPEKSSQPVIDQFSVADLHLAVLPAAQAVPSIRAWSPHKRLMGFTAWVGEFKNRLARTFVVLRNLVQDRRRVHFTPARTDSGQGEKSGFWVALWSGTEELVFSGLLIGGFGALFQVVPVWGGLMLGLSVGLAFSISLFTWLHRHQISYLIKGRLVPALPGPKDFLALGTAGAVIRLTFLTLLVVLPFGWAINGLIGLFTAVLQHSFYGVVVAPFFNLPIGKISHPVKAPAVLFNSAALTWLEPKAELAQLKTVRAELQKEMFSPHSTQLPKMVAFSDVHGTVETLDALLLDALRDTAPAGAKLPAQLDAAVPLAKQGIRLSQWRGRVFFENLGDLLDKNSHGLLTCARVMELVEAGLAESIMGNHDLYAFMNLSGMHLPAYAGFELYGYHDAFGSVADLLAEKQGSDPRARDPRWWAAKLAEYQARQRSQQTRWQEAADRLFEYRDKEDTDWQDLFSALSQVGSVSIGYWQRLLARFEKRYQEDPRKRFKKVIKLIKDEILPRREAELREQVENGKWWWRVFDGINDGFQLTPEWKAQEWILRPDYGGLMLEEANRIRGPGEAPVTQDNYLASPRFKQLGEFFRRRFQLFSRDLYQNHYLHAILPLDPETSEFVITYRGVEYRGRGSLGRPSVWEGLRRIEKDVRNPKFTLADLREAFTLFNQWYLAGSTRTKAPDVASLIRKPKSLDEFCTANGCNRLLTGHVPLNKFLKLDDKARGQMEGFQTGERFFAVDHAMLEGGGAAVHMDPQGVELRGFEFGGGKLKIQPRTLDPKGKSEEVFDNPGIPRRHFLPSVLRDTEARIRELEAQAAPGKARVKPLAEWLFGEPANTFAPVALTGSWPWLRNLFQKWGVSGRTYDRWIAWWLEFTLSFAFSGLLVGIPLGLATGNWYLAFQASYLGTWPIFVAGHDLGQGQKQMPVQQRRLVILLAVASGLLLFLFPAGHVFVIAGSLVLHALVNWLGPKIFHAQALSQESGQPVWKREVWLDAFPGIRRVLLFLSGLLLPVRADFSTVFHQPLPAMDVLNRLPALEQFKRAYFPAVDYASGRFNSGQVNLVPLTPARGRELWFGQLEINAQGQPTIALPALLLRAALNEFPEGTSPQTAAWLRWQAARMLEHQSQKYRDRLVQADADSLNSPALLRWETAESGFVDPNLLLVLGLAAFLFLAPLWLMCASQTPSFFGVVSMLLAVVSLWRTYGAVSWRERLRRLIQIIPHAALTPLLSIPQGDQMTFEHLAQQWQERWVQSLASPGGRGGPFRPRPATKPLRWITHRVELESGLVLPLSIHYGDLDPDSALYRLWEARRTPGEVLQTRQIGVGPVTFLGVLGEPGPLTEAFQRELILSGQAWKHMVHSHLLFVVKDATVEVFFDNQTKPDAKQSRKATELLGAVREQLERDRAAAAQRVQLCGRLSGDAFFGRLVQSPTAEAPALAEAALPAGRVVVAGKIEPAEAESIAQALSRRWADAWNTLGQIFISVTEKGLTVIAEHPEAKALAELQSQVEGMGTVVTFSDTHMADKGRDDNFGSYKEADLMALVRHAADRGSLLVIDGDFLELWKTKYGSIRRSYAELFTLLRQVRRVIYVAGNHDEDVLDEFSRKHRRKAVETAKANLAATDSPEQTAFQSLLAVCPGLAGQKVLLSRGFPETGLARENGTWYADESILALAPADAVRRLSKLKEDWEQHLGEMVAQDTGAELVQYYWDEPRGIYFEHGHVSDPFNYQNRTGRIMARFVGWLERMGWTTAENDLTKLGSLLGKWIPIAGIKETSLILQRVLVLAGLLRENHGQQPQTIIFGHTHAPVTEHMRGINTFTHELYQTNYINLGTWSSMGKRQYLVPRSAKRDWQAGVGLPESEKGKAVSVPLDNHRDWLLIGPNGGLQFNQGLGEMQFIAIAFQALYHDYPRLTAFLIAPLAEGTGLILFSYLALLAGAWPLAVGLALSAAAVLAFKAHARILIIVSPRDMRTNIDGYPVRLAADGSKYYQRPPTLREQMRLFGHFTGMSLLPVFIFACLPGFGPGLALALGLSASVLWHDLLQAGNPARRYSESPGKSEKKQRPPFFRPMHSFLGSA